MGCIVMLAGLVAPRVVIAVLWFFSNWFSSVSDNLILPILGFIFLPYSFLWYSAVINWYGGEWGFIQIVVMIIAVMMDLGASKEGIGRK
jgi:hypothetical protein